MTKIKGYNGIMDLDLTNIPEEFHKELVDLHMKDIEQYKLEQLSRPKNCRYENTVLKANKYWEFHNREVRKRREKEEKEWFERASNKKFIK